MSTFLILAMTSAEFQTLVMGWISVATVILLAVIGLALKLLPSVLQLINAIRDATHLQNETNKLTLARNEKLSASLDQTMAQVNKSKRKRI